MGDAERRQMLGYQAELKEEIESISSLMQTQTKEIRAQCLCLDGLEALPAAAIVINAQALESLHARLMDKLKKLRAVNEALGRHKDEPFI